MPAVKPGYLEGTISYLPANLDHLDILAGIRHLSLEDGFQLGPGPGFEEHHTWTAPPAWLTLQNIIANNWHYVLRGDAGGFTSALI